MIRIARPSKPRAFSLVEALAVVIMVAVAVPPMASVAWSHARASGDAARRHAAVHLAVGVLETIIADGESAAPDLGFSGFARIDYLDAPINGLRTRLDDMTEPATSKGITYEIEISEPFDSAGDPALPTEALAMRLITVTASWRNTDGRASTFQLQTAVVNR